MQTKKLKITIRQLAVAAMLTAMSVVIGIFCKTVLNFGNGVLRITFENLPIILSGVTFGPIVGGLVGACSDLLSYLLSSQVYPPNLIVTLGATVIGVVSGLTTRYLVKKKGTRQFIVAGGLSHLIGSMIIKSIGLFQFYQWLVLIRIPLYLIIASVEIMMMSLLYRRNSIRRLIDSFEVNGNDVQ